MSSVDPTNLLLHPTAVKRVQELAPDCWHLSLARLGLTDTDARELVSVAGSKLGQIKNLDLSGNKLTVWPTWLTVAMPQLEELSLYKNSIASIPAGVFPRLKNLHTLLISDNRLRTLPGDFSKASSLRVVSLGFNRFSSIPSALAGLQTLESCELMGNPMKMNLNQTELRQYLSNLPQVGSLGFGSVLSCESSQSADFVLHLLTREGLVSKKLHKCIIQREPALRCKNLEMSLGDGTFSLEAWNLVLQFFYTGILSILDNVPMAAEVASLLEKHPFESLSMALEQYKQQKAHLQDAGKQAACILAANLAANADTLAAIAAQNPDDAAAASAAATALAEANAAASTAPPMVHPADLVFDGASSLCLHFESLFEHAQETGDFEICCEDGVIVRAHQVVLETRIPFFDVLVHCNMLEASRKRVTVQFSSSVVFSVLEWSYTDFFGIMHEADLVALLQAAKFLQMTELSIEVQSMLGDSLDLDNASWVLKLADLLSESLLMEMVTSYLKSNWFRCLELPDYRDLPPNLKKIICQ